MANTEKRDCRTELHFLLAFRRRKDNPDGNVRCFREIIHDEPVDLERLKVRCRTVPGVWRIHRTVNARNVAKAAKILMKRLIDNPRDAEALETVWKTCLLQKESRGERRFLLDVDDPAQCEVLAARVPSGAMLKVAGTPSGGFHFVTLPFDPRLIEGIPDVSIQRDGYIFVEQLTVPEKTDD